MMLGSSCKYFHTLSTTKLKSRGERYGKIPKHQSVRTIRMFTWLYGHFNLAGPSIFAKSCTLVQKIYMDSMAIETTFGRRSCGSNTEASKCAQHSGIHMMIKCEFLLVKWSIFAKSYTARHKLSILYKVIWNKVRSKKLWPKNEKPVS